MLTCPSELVGARYRGLYGITVMGAYPIGIEMASFKLIIEQFYCTNYFMERRTLTYNFIKNKCLVKKNKFNVLLNENEKKNPNMLISKIGIMLMTGLAIIIQAIGHIFILKSETRF